MFGTPERRSVWSHSGQPVHGRQDEAEKSATKSFDVREFLSKCLATRARAAAPAAPSAASAAVPWVAAATEDPPPTAAAPSVEGLLELLALVADECRDNSGDDVFSKAFLQRYGDCATAFKARTPISDACFEFTQKIAEGSTADIFLAGKKGIPGISYALKRMSKQRLLNQPRSVCFWEERDFLVLASKKLEEKPEGSGLANGNERAGLDSLVRLRYAFHTIDCAFLVTDFYPGGDLCALCDKYETFSEEMAKFYIAETILALETVHKLGYVHRDVKPDNIFLDARGHVHLGDFGACAKLDATGNVPAKERTLAFNSPEYISPELMLAMSGDTSVEYGPECDWWSLGVVLYEMLHGHGPFESGTQLGVHRKVMNHAQHLVWDAEITLSDEVKDLLQRLICGRATRLGTEEGTAKMKQHPFFSSIDWPSLREGKAPFVPELSSLTDTSLFDSFEDDDSSSLGSPAKTVSGLSSRSASLTGSGSGSMSQATMKAMPFIGYEHMQDDTDEVAKVETPKHHRLMRRRSSGPLDNRFKRNLSNLSMLSTAKQTDEQESMLSTPLPSQLDSPNAQMEQMASSLRETPPRRIRFDTTVVFLDSAKNGELETVTSTLPADIEIATATGMTAVCLAANYGHLEVLEYLIGEGGDVNASCEDGCTPLHLAILEEHIEIITCLLKHGADVTATNIDNESALDWAADSEPIRLLLESKSLDTQL